MNFKKLVHTIHLTHNAFQQSSVKAVNRHLTIRNWLIGLYIVEFEQKGEYRAAYGKKMLENLAEAISLKGLTAPELSRCRQFYQTYSEILGTLSHKFTHILPENILGTLSQKSLPDNSDQNVLYLEKLVSTIPYSHFTELIKIADTNKRRFYELLIIKTNP